MRKLLCIIFFLLLACQAFSASVLVNPKFAVYDSNGDPVSGGLIYTYECGTTTEKTTYTDYTEGTANANPVVLDSSGQAEIFSSDCIKIVIKTSAGSTLNTIDNVQGYDSTILQDADRDTMIQVEESSDEDVIRFDVGGTQKVYIDSNGLHSSSVTFDQGKGDVRRPDFSWKDADEIYIGAGGAYHHSGTSDQFVTWTTQITFQAGSGGSNSDSTDLAASDWYYLYLDDSAIVTQGSNILDADCFLLSTTEPSWSGTKYGYYNSDDRAIFAVYADVSGNIDEFHHYGDLVLWADSIGVDSNTVVGSTPVDTSAFIIPSFAVKVHATFSQKYVDGTYANLSWRTNGQTSSNGHYVLFTNADGENNNNSMDIITDSSGIIEWWDSGNTNATSSVREGGWYLPNGM